MITIKIDNLYAIIFADDPSPLYPRIFLTKEEAEECAKFLGGKYEIKSVFINN